MAACNFEKKKTFSTSTNFVKSFKIKYTLLKNKKLSKHSKVVIFMI